MALPVAQLDPGVVADCACPDPIAKGKIAALSGAEVPSGTLGMPAYIDPNAPTTGRVMSPEEIEAHKARMRDVTALPAEMNLAGAPVFDRSERPIGHVISTEQATDGTLLSALVTLEQNGSRRDVRMEAESMTIMGGDAGGLEVILDLSQDAIDKMPALVGAQ
jgi:hypothetical protein